VAWAVARRVGSLVVGDLTGIEAKRSGRHHNRRTTRWRRAHLLRALADKAEVAGMAVVKLGERGTSSTCPRCGARSVAQGRVFVCSSCSYRGHRDLVGARNIAARGGGITTEPSVVTHRRVGAVRTRRDRRRQLMDDRRRSCPTSGRLRRKLEELPSRGLSSHVGGGDSSVVEAGDRAKTVA
jgi:transposase